MKQNKGYFESDMFEEDEIYERTFPFLLYEALQYKAEYSHEIKKNLSLLLYLEKVFYFPMHHLTKPTTHYGIAQ